MDEIKILSARARPYRAPMPPYIPCKRKSPELYTVFWRTTKFLEIGGSTSDVLSGEREAEEVDEQESGHLYTASHPF